MYKGQFRTDTFNVSKPEIIMRNWVQPTLYNTGEEIIFLNGIAICPGDSFVIGANGVEMNGVINLIFDEGIGKKEAKVNYVLLQTC